MGHLETLLWHMQNVVSLTLPGWQEQAETHLSIRAHFIPIKTGILRPAGGRSSCCRYWTASLLLWIRILFLPWDVSTAENDFFKVIQNKTPAFKWQSSLESAFISPVFKFYWKEDYVFSSASLFVIIINSLKDGVYTSIQLLTLVRCNSFSI